MHFLEMTNSRRAALLWLGLAAGCAGLPGEAPSAPDDAGDPDAKLGGSGDGAVTTGVLANVVLSEIMYAPVDETTDEENHEFVEIYNRGKDPVSLAGWTLRAKKGMSYTFPPAATIPAG